MSRTRLLVVLGVVAAAAVIAVVVVLVAVGTGSGSSDSGTTLAAPTTTAASTGGATTAVTPVSVLKGIPQHGATLGSPSAPTTLQVFEDPQCPFCQEWALGTLPTVVQRYVRTGKVKLVYEGVEIIGPNSVPGLRAIYAAASQNKLWNLAEELYERQGGENSGWITPAVIRSAAAAAGADPDAVISGSSSAAVNAYLKSAAAAFQAIGAPGTPTFVVQHPPALQSVLQLSALDPSSFDSALDSAIQ